MVYLLVPVLLLVLMPIPVRGSDAKGNSVALGFGLESRQTFLHARSNRLDLPYRHWLTGYLTAVNNPTATLLEHALLAQGFMGVQKTASPCCLRPQNRDFTCANLVEALK